MSAVPGTARLTDSLQEMPRFTKLNEKTASAHPSFTADRQMGASSG